MIGERVVIIVDEETKGLIGEVVKIDHDLCLYGLKIENKGYSNSVFWFLREDFEVIA